jgi:hypothetical protein
MTIEFYVNQSEKNRLDKTLVSAFNLNGELKEDCSIIDPVIKIVGDVSSMASVNYMYIPSFGRYYFINNVISINNEICEVHAHVDVLSTYKNEIRAQRAVVSRQEKKWNLYLNDGVFKTYQNPYIITKAFSSGFTSQHFVLSIAGG